MYEDGQQADATSRAAIVLERIAAASERAASVLELRPPWPSLQYNPYISPSPYIPYNPPDLRTCGPGFAEGVNMGIGGIQCINSVPSVADPANAHGKWDDWQNP
jgi:hypothetical protein